MQLLDLALAFRLGVRADTWIERPAGVLEQLLLPGIDLVRMNLVPPRQIGVVASSRTAASAILAFIAGSIFRRVFLVIVSSVYHDGTTLLPTKRPVLKSRATSLTYTTAECYD